MKMNKNKEILDVLEEKKSFTIVEEFVNYEKTVVKARNIEEATKIISDDDNHQGEIIDCYENE